MSTWIRLPHGGKDAGLDARELVAHIQRSGRDYIIQGQTNCRLSDHPKPRSLDAWLRRNHTARRDTKQAVNTVVDDLVATGLFVVSWELSCPDSGRECKGLRLATTE